jgi:hypothetical protein
LGERAACHRAGAGTGLPPRVPEHVGSRGISTETALRERGHLADLPQGGDVSGEAKERAFQSGHRDTGSKSGKTKSRNAARELRAGV